MEELMQQKTAEPRNSKSLQSIAGSSVTQRRDQKEITLKTAVAVAERTRWDGSKSLRTTMINAIDIIKFFGGDTLVSDIETEDIDNFVDHLVARGITNGTINRKLSVLSVLIKTAEENGRNTAKPTIRRKREYRGRERFLTREEEERLLAILEHWGKLDIRDAVIVLLDTGMRCGELLRIRREDLDFTQSKHGIVTLWETKTDRPRSCPMTTRVAKVMRRRLAKSDDERLFPYTDAWLRHTWDRAKAYLGLEDDAQFVPHILRHTCASRLVQLGVPIQLIQQWMGHSSLQSTMRYAHLSPKQLFGVVDILESVV